MLSKGIKNRHSGAWGTGNAVRSIDLETAINNGIEGKCGAQLKLMYFLTGNADNGSFSVPEKTVCERCGMTEETYKKARKALVAKGWIIHGDGKIVVDYDAIYNSSRDTEDPPTNTKRDIEDKSRDSIQDPSVENHEYTHNSIMNSININTLSEKERLKYFSENIF